MPDKFARADGIADRMIVRLFRLWSALTEREEEYLPAMYELASSLHVRDELPVCCASLFELVEGHLGRRLVRECCCSQKFSPDEQALLGVVRFCSAMNAPYTTRDIPHGLPGAIVWAAISVREALDLGEEPLATGRGSRPVRAKVCPFNIVSSRQGVHHGF
ncbi:MAG: hypothetical protein ACK5NN_02385 [Sphingomonadaceae bacterium]